MDESKLQITVTPNRVVMNRDGVAIEILPNEVAHLGTQLVQILPLTTVAILASRMAATVAVRLGK